MIRKNISFITSVFSILLLTAFLAYFLRNEYMQEKSRLNKEVAYIFINAVKNIEGSFFNKIFFREKSEKPLNAISPPIQNIKDSTKIFAFVRRDQNDSIQISHKTTISISEKEISSQEVSGVLSMIVNLKIDSLGLDSIRGSWKDSLANKKTNFLPIISEQFQKSLKAADIDIVYSIVKDTSNLPENENFEIAASYSDIGSNDKFFVLTGNNYKVILKNIWPQCMLSFGLLALMILTFFSVHSSMNKSKALSDMKNDFIQNMTHELKTPVATMSVALEAISNFDASNDAEKRKEYLRIARSESARMALLVDKVLSLSAMDGDFPYVHFVTVDANKCIQNVADLFIYNENIKIVFTPSEQNAKVLADKEWLQICLHNLMDNAIKYKDQKQSVLYIDVHTKDNKLIINMTDNNPAIAPAYYEKIFEKFYRISDGNLHNVKGHGLGLYFVKNLMRKMNGDVKVHAFTEGNTFTLELPLSHEA